MISAYTMIKESCDDMYNMIADYVDTYHDVDIKEINLFCDTEHMKPWNDRAIFNELLNKLKPGDLVLISKPSHLCHSTLEIIELLNIFAKKEVNVEFLNIKKRFKPVQNTIDSESLFGLLQEAQCDFLAEEIGFDFGDEAMFEQYHEIIKEHIQSGASLDMLSKVINCHPDRLKAYVHENISWLLNLDLEEEFDEDDKIIKIYN